LQKKATNDSPNINFPNMILTRLFLTHNACFQADVPLQIRGVMLHSTGANNPNLRRYVGPDDGKLGHNPNNNHWNQPNPEGRSVCVHAFIGKLANGDIATYQTLPWNMRGWHSGGGANNTHIGFEICEDNLNDAQYFHQAYQEAAALCAYLCKEYSLDPLGDGVLIDHSEGFARGIATNHKDVGHWFPKFGKNMDIFRTDVHKMMTDDVEAEPEPEPEPEPPSSEPEQEEEPQEDTTEKTTEETNEIEDATIDEKPEVEKLKWYVRILNFFKKLIKRN